jgi:hypothetical protein
LSEAPAEQQLLAPHPLDHQRTCPYRSQLLLQALIHAWALHLLCNAAAAAALHRCHQRRHRWLLLQLRYRA